MAACSLLLSSNKKRTSMQNGTRTIGILTTVYTTAVVAAENIERKKMTVNIVEGTNITIEKIERKKIGNTNITTGGIDIETDRGIEIEETDIAIKNVSKMMSST